MGEMIKRLARWILHHQIQHDEDHIKRLQGYCVDLGVSSKLEPDLEGKDRTYEFQRSFDVFGGVELAIGTFRINNVICLNRDKAEPSE